MLKRASETLIANALAAMDAKNAELMKNVTNG
jgi:hypothetical protein